MPDMGSDAKNMDPIWLDMKVCVCVQMSDTGSDAETMDPVWRPAWCMCVCVCVQMSDTGSDAENMDPVPDNTVREPPKEPEPAPKRRRLGKLQRAK